MVSSTAPLTYKGSISEAIIEAQKQKKLFLVYISGEDENSANLVKSTWANERVAESVSRYCIFLHLIEGHVEASQFSAIYPQKSVPSISAVGYNGVMLWQHEGYISVESFVESVAKAWAAMHFQNTAAAFLTAAIATKKPEPSSSVPTDVAPIEQGESYSSLRDPLHLADDNHAQNLEAGPSNDPEPLVEQQEDIGCEDNKHLQLHTANAVKTHREDTEIKERGTVEILHSVTQISPNSEMAPLENVSHEHHSKSSPEPAAGEINLCSPESSQINANDIHEGKATVINEVIDKKNDIKSTDIHLSIRMPSGGSLQAKFIASDRLRSVKNYVDDNNGGMIGSYDLAIPYPLKVFGEEDMNKSLAELGFTGRQALIVIPKSQVPGRQRGMLSNDIQTSANQTNSNDSAPGYFVYLTRVLSYMNPLSYLSGSRSESSTSERAPNDGLWQFHPNPGLQNSLSGRETAHSPYPSNPQNSAIGGNASISGRTSRPFGSNIHTLRQDEDDFRSDDRNIFWNGNSTQFGGNDK